ncbi:MULTISPECIES: S8 family peptidase [unclassified Tolypothrix]|uniref:S8 family peptidase n=1 Tax=unclassified Tolypothrix TaxID=2649714 RepID=UPI0005EAB5E1|nr:MULTISPECIES: PatA/PatG family cyanobactin maturation protease [unclassified Tolypothrix]BAY91230.1 peptidase S8/S53 [Microchaete diplosiphon NIES-3275]EKE96496.1 peptidase families S8 and S53 [Tolypothrix sp. PCC 7601]MBE9080872.1 PatA/PatG family cyanobactin maturation protease [Tolypothrix sp. LEGE 11397]UYD25308.1 PatA/PatG family cyanobactin maturation protease [Tolypothrix sp. PCC 7712]UYD32449.1 PatA/PatG family cyanobactin maturation protease [Tolypothrix sp. PCC 7601]
MPELNTIPGFAALQALTRGDSRIKIAVLDGLADLDRACFRGANLSKAKAFWQTDLEPIEPIYIQRELLIRKLGDKKKALKKALKQIEKRDTDTALLLPVAQVMPSRSHLPITTIFNAVLENTEALLLEQYHQLKDSKLQQTTHKPGIPADIDYKAEIKALEIEIEALEDSIPEPVRDRLNGIFHATGIFSTMFGQPGSPVEGVAPYCTAINIPLFETPTSDEALSPLNLARAFNLALELGVNIIHCAACHPTQTGFAHEMIQKAVKQCQDNNILIVAPSGNNKGEWFCAPAILPNVLAVGMMKDDGQPANYSNWGGQYQEQGILAPGENIVAAQPGTDEPALQQGTSLAAPLITGISALLMSLQLQRGEKPNAEAVRTALLNSAIKCDPNEIAEPERCLVGKLNIPGAYQLLTGQLLPNIQASAVALPQVILPAIPDSSKSAVINASQPLNEIYSSTSTQFVTASATIADIAPSTVTPSAVSRKVYALGSLGYDFGSEARRDTFKQQMSAVSIDGVLIPANPYDARQMVNHLELNPSEGKSLIWTLNQELTPIYALEPQKAFASEIYNVFQMLLAGQIQPEESDDYIERVSIPGNLTDRTVELFSGQVVPVLALPNIRGIYGWQVNALVEAAINTVTTGASQPDNVRMRRSLKSFLHRIYYDLRNLGHLDRDRALNFAATNAFQAASTFAEAINSGMELDSIEIEKSPFCRLNSNCWDVMLKFFDSENSRRAKKVYRFTIDVANLMPVTLGAVRSWSVPR